MALREFASILQRAFRSPDVIGRIGGDEFCVLSLAGCPPGTAPCVSRIRALLHQRNLETPEPYALEASFGHVVLDASRHDTIADLMSEADARMYEEKRARALGER